LNVKGVDIPESMGGGKEDNKESDEDKKNKEIADELGE